MRCEGAGIEQMKSLNSVDHLRYDCSSSRDRRYGVRRMIAKTCTGRRSIGKAEAIRGRAN